MASKDVTTKSEAYTLTKYWENLIQNLKKLKAVENTEDKSDATYNKFYDDALEMAEAGRKLESLSVFSKPSLTSEGERVRKMGEKFDAEKFPIETKSQYKLALLYIEHLKHYDQIHSSSLLMRNSINREKEFVKKNLKTLEDRLNKKMNGENAQQSIQSLQVLPQTISSISNQMHEIEKKEVKEFITQNDQRPNSLLIDHFQFETNDILKDKKNQIQKYILQQSNWRINLLKALDLILMKLFQVSFFKELIPEDDYFLIKLENRFFSIENQLLKIQIQLREERELVQEEKYTLDLQKLKMAEEETFGSPPIVKSLSPKIEEFNFKSPKDPFSGKKHEFEIKSQIGSPSGNVSPLKPLEISPYPLYENMGELYKEIEKKQKSLLFLKMKLSLSIGFNIFYSYIYKHEKAWYDLENAIVNNFEDSLENNKDAVKNYWYSLILIIKNIKVLKELIQEIQTCYNEENEPFPEFATFIKALEESNAELVKYCQQIGSLILKPNESQFLKNESQFLSLFESEKEKSRRYNILKSASTKNLNTNTNMKI